MQIISNNCKTQLRSSLEKKIEKSVRKLLNWVQIPLSLNTSFKRTFVDILMFGVVSSQAENLYPTKRIAVWSVKTFKYLAGEGGGCLSFFLLWKKKKLSAFEINSRKRCAGS